MNKKEKIHTEPNSHERLEKDDYFIKNLKEWPKKNTAFLINHGIGNQKPIETLGTFTEGIIQALTTYNGITLDKLKVEHHLQPKKAGDEMCYYWFDNFIRISNADEKAFIDIYEYYWANQTENKISYRGILTWLSCVVSGAEKNYEGNEEMTSMCNDKSIFIDKNGKLNYWKYFIYLRVIGSAVTFLHIGMSSINKFVKHIPVIGFFISPILEFFKPKIVEEFTNVIGDIAVYNDPNPRSSNQDIRKAILEGCVKAIQFLVEPDNENNYRYEQVVIAAHSLGTEISFDAINRLTHQINLGELSGYNKNGDRVDKDGLPILNANDEKININKILHTFITFGSPLDKVAFFFREQSKKDEYVKRQVLENFHCFKQRQWIDVEVNHPKIGAHLNRVFDDIKWRNYYDNRDYVSGSLDYYHGLTNINCTFKKSWFTHSNYWTSNQFFGDVLITIFN